MRLGFIIRDNFEQLIYTKLIQQNEDLKTKDKGDFSWNILSCKENAIRIRLKSSYTDLNKKTKDLTGSIKP